MSKYDSMFERTELHVLRKRIQEPRKFIQVIIGPRQVGKTTLANQLFKEQLMPGIFESADGILTDESVWLEQIWNSARVRLNSGGAKEFLIIVDEVQKIRNWSELIKRFWDEDSRTGINIKVILLGSSRLLVHKGLTESLAGRFETIHLTHWSYQEMKAAFGWNHEQFVWFGGYPGSSPLIHEEARWKRYIQDALIETSVSKDILMLTRIDKPALLKKLFSLGCYYSGQILSFTKILGQLQDAGNTTTLAHYLQLLSGAGLLDGLEKYSGTIIRTRSSSPKFQVLNTGLISAQRIDIYEDRLNHPEQWGRLVESSIGAHLLNQAIKNHFEVYYWREGNLEVDFVLVKDQTTIAIEVKSGLAANTAGLQKFKDQYHPEKVYLIDNKMLSWREFLEIDALDLF